MMRKKFFICCRRGCPRRSLDSSTTYNYLNSNDWKATKNFQSANLLIVYTCGGFQSAEENSLMRIKDLVTYKKENAKLIITGCLNKINPTVLADYKDYCIDENDMFSIIDEIIGPEKAFRKISDANIVQNVVDISFRLMTLKSLISQFSPNINFAKLIKQYINFKKTLKRNPRGVFPDDVFHLKIASGCLGICSYCAIRIASGKLRSKPLDEILKEFQIGLNSGFKRFVLLAQDIGCYGMDIGGDISTLLEQIFKREEEFSIILNDINPKWLIHHFDRLFPILVENQDRIEDMRIPIQSGSDKILKKMRRGYKSNDVISAIEKLREKIPNLKIATHVMVGFPGETDIDFDLTKNTLLKLEFERVSVYIYEDRPGTEASKISDKVPYNITINRVLEIEAPQLIHGIGKPNRMLKNLSN